jgi:TolB-like protein
MDTVYAFGPFRLDTSTEILCRGADPLPVGRRAVGVLRVLLEHAGSPVSKDALMLAAWPGLAVEEGNLTVQIAALRRVLGEEPGENRWIETLPRRGYRFIGLVDARGINGAQISADQEAPERFLPLPDKPSIAVLQFANLSDDLEQEYFADGMVEEIITALSRIRWLFVIARNSSFTYKGHAVDVKQVGRELGVRYVLEGSVRKSGTRVRITTQLIDATNGAHLWADHFDGSLEDVLDLQEQVAISVAGVIEPALRAAEIRRAVERPRHDPTAYDLYLRALQALGSWEKQGHMEALNQLSHATRLDATYGPALALSAWCHMALNGSGWTDDPEATRQKAISLARHALRNAGDDAETISRAAYVLAYYGEGIDTLTALMDRSLRITPSFADGWHWSGWLRMWAGSPNVAIEHFERSLRLDPRDPKGRILMANGIAHFFARHLDQARTMLLLSLQEHPDWVPTNRFLAACYAHLGQLDEAKNMIRRLRALTPVVLPNADHWRNPEQREFYLSGLRLAMSETE